MSEAATHTRQSFLRNAAVAIAAVEFSGVGAIASGTGDEGRMPDLDGAEACINSLRELPYMKAWAAKYKDAGLVVIGVHAPEFALVVVPQRSRSEISRSKRQAPSTAHLNDSLNLA